jgi:hypothetical protein
MPEVVGSDEVEWTIKEWFKNKYSDHLVKVNFINLWKEGELWTVDCEVTVKKGLMSKEPLKYKFQVAGLGKIIGYKTTPE